MKITIINDYLNSEAGGANFSLELMLRLFNKRGHEARLVTLDSTNNNFPTDIPADIISKQTDLRNPIDITKNLRQSIEGVEHDTDIFHIYKPIFHPFCGYLTKMTDTPIVGRLNNYLFCTNPSRMDGVCHANCSLYRKFVHQSGDLLNKVRGSPVALHKHASLRYVNSLDSLFAISPAVKEIYAGAGVNEDLISVIPNCYDPKFAPERVSTGLENDIPKVLYVGRLERVKGIDVLLQAVKEMSCNIMVDIVGDGELKDAIQRSITDNDIEEAVNLHGWVDHDDLPRYYDEADIFVHPGLWPEPFGRTLLEAMQYACVPVVSDIGGPPWAIGDAGLTFERNNAADLAKKLESLTSSPTSIEMKKNLALDRIQEFDPESTISAIEEEYKQVLN